MDPSTWSGPGTTPYWPPLQTTILKNKKRTNKKQKQNFYLPQAEVVASPLVQYLEHGIL